MLGKEYLLSLTPGESVKPFIWEWLSKKLNVKHCTYFILTQVIQLIGYSFLLKDIS
ncbi:MAG: hypothetical protein H6R25_3020 [Proteobacteria bacterium]|nr:hypothetical protein [Pseudomonadota bacterium]